MIYAGTCSWAEKTLLESGEFYPAAADNAEKRLRHYSSVFDTVEVDSTYYAVPQEKTVALWRERTPRGFVFHVKAYAAITGHPVAARGLPPELRGHAEGKEGPHGRVYVKDPSALSDIAESFRNAISPLGEKLGIVVLQFPPWLRLGEKSMEDICFRGRLLDGISVGVEFRHGSWLSEKNAEKTLGFLEKNGFVYITADEPQYGTLATPPFYPAAVSGTAYFRFHGRNARAWLKRGVQTSERYRYLYSDSELKEFLAAARRADSIAGKTYAMFNNCHGGFAVRNALRFMELAEG